MFIFVLSKTGKPLMPTQRCGWVRRALKNGKAKVVRREPFTIQLLYDCPEITQDLVLGVDAGSKHIGLSATTGQKEVFSATVELRTDIVDLLSSRREMRRSRRNRTTRYRKPRFNNRTRPEGWLAPSVRWKVEAHKRIIKLVYSILPISKTIVETAQFDIQKIKNSEIAGKQYQQGEQLGFANVREYVLYRDGHKCRQCGTKKAKFHVHHIESCKTGGDAPNNLVTLCEVCHCKVHEGVPLKVKRDKSFRDATGMTIMRPTLLRELREIYPYVIETYGYITKEIRHLCGIEKSHVNDARCISSRPNAAPCESLIIKFVRKNNRQLHKCTISKGGVRKANKAQKYVFGFQLFDKVEYQGQQCFIFGRRSSGSFDVRKLDGTKVSASISYKKLKLLKKSTTILLERVDSSNG